MDSDEVPFPAPSFLELLRTRRTATRLRQDSAPNELITRIEEAIALTPAAFNQPPWVVVLVDSTREAFWSVMEQAVRTRLHGDRLDRYLRRFMDARAARLVALVFEDQSVGPGLVASAGISEEDARSFVDQALGMVQLSIWLTAVESGMSTSLQHWAWLAGQEINDFAGIGDRSLKLVSVMPIGIPDGPPSPKSSDNRVRVFKERMDASR